MKWNGKVNLIERQRLNDGCWWVMGRRPSPQPHSLQEFPQFFPFGVFGLSYSLLKKRQALPANQTFFFGVACLLWIGLFGWCCWPACLGGARPITNHSVIKEKNHFFLYGGSEQSEGASPTAQERRKAGKHTLSLIHFQWGPHAHPPPMKAWMKGAKTNKTRILKQ